MGELLARALESLGLPPERSTKGLLDLAMLVARWNARTNLTGHRDPEAILRRLVVDALALYVTARDLVQDPDTIVDLGSGAGFPGLPIALLAPRSRVVLVDSRERRYHFQRAACRELGLTNVEPRLGRVEDIEPDLADLVIAQAIARPPLVLAWGVEWLAPGSVLIIPGGADPPTPGEHPGIGESGVARYWVPPDGPHRTFWWGRAVGSVGAT